MHVPQVREAFHAFDVNGAGRISLANMVDAIVTMYKARLPRHACAARAARPMQQ